MKIIECGRGREREEEGTHLTHQPRRFCGPYAPAASTSDTQCSGGAASSGGVRVCAPRDAVGSDDSSPREERGRYKCALHAFLVSSPKPATKRGFQSFRICKAVGAPRGKVSNMKNKKRMSVGPASRRNFFFTRDDTLVRHLSGLCIFRDASPPSSREAEGAWLCVDIRRAASAADREGEARAVRGVRVAPSRHAHPGSGWRVLVATLNNRGLKKKTVRSIGEKNGSGREGHPPSPASPPSLLRRAGLGARARYTHGAADVGRRR